MIGDLGGTVIGGSTVKSALFCRDGLDTVKARLQDPEKFLHAQLEEIDSQSRLKGDYVPTLCPALGVIGIPSAFGCEVVWWENDFPAVRPCLAGDPNNAYDMPEPTLSGGELGRILEYTQYFLEKTGGSVPIRLTDIQGPLDSAALIFGHTSFLPAMYTNRREVHHLLQKVTDLTIAFAERQRELVRSRGAEFVPSMFQPWIPDGFGISVSNDECALLSSDLHDEFGVPYLNQISDAFGGIYVHSCGQWAHQVPSLKNIHNLRGLEFGASEAPYQPILREFSGKVVLAVRVGLHRDLKFRGMSDFVRRVRDTATTNRGLFIHVDITNGIVDESWPPTDLNEIYGQLLGNS